MDLVGISVLIIALASVALVVYLIKVLQKVALTIDETKETIKILTSDVNVTLYQTNDILAKANVLVEDINGKVSTIDPLFVAIADLSESVSDLNLKARHLGQKTSGVSSTLGTVGKSYITGKIGSKLFKKKRSS